MPGHQGPAQDQGRAADDGADDRRPLHGLRADRRGRRRLAPARGRGAHAAAHARPSSSTSAAAARSSAPRRTAPRARTSSASSRTCSSSTRCCRSASRRPRRRRSSSRRPTSRCASCATSSPPTSSARSSTTPSSTSRLVSFFARTAPELVDRVELWEEPTTLFEAYGVEPVIEGMLSRRVDLPSGGYLMIDYAEALTVIDVNTGSFTGKGKAARLEDTITRTNLEAAEEVVNQLRLRDIGGIIVIDFIDMARARNRDAVLKTLRKALDEDRTKTFVVEISPLGLVEMTRQNVTDGAREIMTKTVPDLRRRGRREVGGDDRDRGRAAAARAGRRAGGDGPEAYLVRMNPQGHAPTSPATARACCTRSRRRPAASSTSRAPRGCRSTTSRSSRRARATEIEEQQRPVPRGRGGARRHRRAAHVLRGRRGRQGRRLPDRGRRRDRATSARRCSCGSSRRAARRRAPCSSRSPRRPRRRARSGARRASAAAKRAARRRGRGASASAPRASRPRGEDAGGRGADRRRGAVHAGTGPAAAAEADEDAAKPRGAAALARRARARDSRRKEAARPSADADEGSEARRRGRRATTTRYNRSLGAAAAEADGAVRVRRPKATPRSLRSQRVT